LFDLVPSEFAPKRREVVASFMGPVRVRVLDVFAAGMLEAGEGGVDVGAKGWSAGGQAVRAGATLETRELIPSVAMVMARSRVGLPAR
jgi:hypothetical protein